MIRKTEFKPTLEYPYLTPEEEIIIAKSKSPQLESQEVKPKPIKQQVKFKKPKVNLKPLQRLFFGK